MKNEFVLAINLITETRALPQEVILDALRTALVSAYRRDVSASSAQHVDVDIDMNTGSVTLLVEKEVVKDVRDSRTEVSLEEARQVDPNAELGETLMVPVPDPARKFGRIAAQTAKQVILQKIREAEREALYEEYVERQGDLISGTVQSETAQGVTLSLGRAEALLPRAHMMPGERFNTHDKVRTYLLEIKRGNRGPQIIVSRSHRNMLRRLLEYEVPEIYNGQVEIKSIAREAGHRSKVAVAALQEGIDPVGACVGMRGIRIQNIVRELHGEKIDVIEWNADPAVFITKALSPARVSGVFLDEDMAGERGGMGTATVIVPDDQLSLAIGREGQNARLAAKLTGWRIDIKSVTEAATEALANTESRTLAEMHEANAKLVEEVQRILAKRETGRPVMPEEYQTLTRYANLAEQALLEERRQAGREYRARLDAVRATLPPRAFEMPLSELDLPEEILEALSSRFESVGGVMLYLEADEERVKEVLERISGDALAQVRAVLQEVEIPEEVPEAVTEAEEPVAAEAEMAAQELAPEAEEVVGLQAQEAPQVEPLATVPPYEGVQEADLVEAAQEAIAEELEGEAPPAIIEPEPEPRRTPLPAQPEPKREEMPTRSFAPEDVSAPAYQEDEELERLMGGGKSKKKKKAKQRRRQLVYDEEAGKVVAKRKRRGSRKQDFFWDEEEFDEGI